MKTSELIAALQAEIDQHGDLDVYIKDADTGWHLTPNVRFIDQWRDGPKEAVVGLCGSYDEVRER